jgi:hypothetical protein
MEALADSVGAAIAESVAPLKKRFAELERRVEAAEATGLKYMGVHQRALDYPRGGVVTQNGSLWVALRAISAGGDRPGEGDGNPWQLIVKRGQDGKDSRDKGVVA